MKNVEVADCTATPCNFVTSTRHFNTNGSFPLKRRRYLYFKFRIPSLAFFSSGYDSHQKHFSRKPSFLYSITSSCQARLLCHLYSFIYLLIINLDKNLFKTMIANIPPRAYRSARIILIYMRRYNSTKRFLYSLQYL